jgi:hypothetical protein
MVLLRLVNRGFALNSTNKCTVPTLTSLIARASHQHRATVFSLELVTNNIFLTLMIICVDDLPSLPFLFSRKPKAEGWTRTNQSINHVQISNLTRSR